MSLNLFQKVPSSPGMRSPRRPLAPPSRVSTNEANCPAMKAGGMVNHHFMEVEVRCLASLLPEYIEVDLSQMAMDQILHLSDLSLPKGVHLVDLTHGHTADHNHAVVSIHMPRQKAEPEATTEVKETEVVAKGKDPAAAAAKEAVSKGKDKGK